MSAPLSNPADVEKMIEAMKAAALSSCNFTPGVVGTGKPLTVATVKTYGKAYETKSKPKSADKKVSDIF